MTEEIEGNALPVRTDALPSHAILIIALNAAFGTALLRLGQFLQCGVISGALIALVVELAAGYGVWLFSRVAIVTRKGNMADIAGACWGPRMRALLMGWNTFSCVMSVRAYMGQLVTVILEFLHHWGFAEASWANDGVALMTAVLTWTVALYSWIGLRVIWAVSWLVMPACLTLLCHLVSIAARAGSPEPLSWWRFNTAALRAPGIFTLAASIHPICYPGFNHWQNTTPRAMGRTYTIAFAIVGVVSFTFGVSGYAANPAAQSGTPFDELSGTEWRLSHFMEATVLVCSIPVYLQAGAFSLTSIYDAAERCSSFVWFAASVCIAVMAGGLSQIQGRFGLILEAVWELVTVEPYILPGVLALKTGHPGGRHKTLAVILLAFGCALVMLRIGVAVLDLG